MRLGLNYKTWIAVVVLLVAAGIWTRPLWQHRTPSENSLRQTTGVTVAVLASQATPRGWQVQCRVVNERPRVVEQVVLRLTLTDSTGRVLAANPLAGVSQLAANDTREESFLIPFHGSITNPQIRAEVSLVRWQQ